MAAPGFAALAPRWALLDEASDPPPVADGATNMATDMALLALAARTGSAAVRLYGWHPPTISLGRHERARGMYDLDALARAGVGIVRRPTGGRALFHAHEVTYAVAAPARLPLAATYAAVNALLVDALARLGVHARPAPRPPRTLRPDGAACFAEPGEGELVVDGAKLIGSAQYREGGAFVQHGSLLLADDQPRIAAFRTGDRPETRPAATLGALLGTVAPRDVAHAVTAALRAVVELVPLDPALLRDDLARLVIAFADPSWTWRR